MPNMDHLADWTTGVYQIRCTVDGHFYVGGAYADFQRRWKDHRDNLRKGTHGNRHLQSAWNLHGEDNFEFEVMERCPPDDVLEREQAWINANFDGSRVCYNICPVAQSRLGVPHSDETIQRLRDWNTGRVMPREGVERTRSIHLGRVRPPETGERISAAKKASDKTVAAAIIASAAAAEVNRGKHLTDEHKDKISEANTGKVRTPETCAKISKASTGRRHTPESRALMKITNGHGNLGMVHTPETRAKMSAAKKGKQPRLGVVLTDATKAKISASKKGRKMSDQARANMRAGRAAARAKREAQAQEGAQP